jgi:peroxiredoxin
MAATGRTLALILLTVIAAAPAAAQPAARSLAGRWDATVVVNGVAIPCRFDLTENNGSVQGSFFNGDEKVSSTKGTFADGVLTLVWEQYGSTLTADVRDGELDGKYDRRTRGLYPFRARRYTPVRVDNGAPPIAGTWKVVVNGKSEKAWRFIVRQQGGAVDAAIQRVDGDTGLLSGRYSDGSFLLSHFDGARPMLLKVTPKSDKSLELVEDAKKTYTAVRENSAEAAAAGDPADPFAYTRMKNPDEPFHFSFPDLDGRTVSDSDARFKGKVVIATVTGSWCPNCHDEAPFLVSLYRKYRGQGLEIVAISFEEAEQLANPTRPRAFIKQFGIQYPFLLAGEPGQLAAKIPQAENLDSFPTMFIIGRDGKVRSVHAGYSSIATGELYTVTTREITRQVQRLLAEKVKGTE